MGYESDIKINESALDVEWINQPNLMVQYGRHYAYTEREMEKAKAHLEVLRAELDKKIRSNPDDYGIAKITESVISNTITLQSEYREAQVDFLDTKYEYEMAKLAIRALDHRKQALENLVKLHGQQYFAGPSVPRDLSKEWEQEERNKKADSKIRMRRTRKNQDS